jgi:hypothetical protein
LTASGDRVYVLRGPTLYQFSVSGLKLVKKLTLPAAVPPARRPGVRSGAPPPDAPEGSTE